MPKNQYILLILIGLLGATLFANSNVELSADTGKTATTATVPSRSTTTTTTTNRTVRPTAEPTSTPSSTTTPTTEPSTSERETTTPEPTPTPEPDPEREPTPPRETTVETTTTEPTPEPTPVTTPAEPTPAPEPEPQPVPDPTPEPTPEPIAQPEPTPAATSTPEPEAAAAPTPAPTTTTQTYTRPVSQPAAVTTPIVEPEPEPESEQSEIISQWDIIAAIPLGTNDLDHDGLSNNIEFLENTDPLNPDTDGDQLTDSEEVIDFKTDPLDPNSPERMSDLGIRITSFEEGQIVADPQPFIKGVAPISSYIQVSATNEQGETTILGQTQTHENSIFTFVSPPLEDGTYTLIVEQIEEPDVIDELFTPAHAQTEEEEQKQLVSDPITIVIDTSSDVTTPTPELLDNQEITPEVLMENVRIEIENDQPVLRGNTVFQHKVIATWQSVVFSSALIADSSAGEFEIRPQQKFESGNHEVYVQAVHPTTGAVSKKVRVPFVVVHAESVDMTMEGSVAESAATPEVRPAAEEESFIQNPVLSWIIANPIPTAIAVGIILFLIFKVAKREEESMDPDL